MTHSPSIYPYIRRKFKNSLDEVNSTQTVPLIDPVTLNSKQYELWGGGLLPKHVALRLGSTSKETGKEKKTKEKERNRKWKQKQERKKE